MIGLTLTLENAEAVTATLLWCRYYIDVELHDRTLPGAWSAWDANVWVPRAMFRGTSARRANDLRRELVRKAETLRLSAETLEVGRDAASKMSHIERVRFSERREVRA